jgi:PIN domain nuclease of toxin-antitoxin system
MSESYLLDTSTILWALATPERLSIPARTAIESGHLVLSVISYWEVMVKSNKGLLNVGDPVEWWHVASDALNAQVLALRASHVTVLQGLPDHHKDPFDRMLIGQAITERMTLITSDEIIHKYPVEVLW